MACELKFEKINYHELNARAKEIYNFQKVSAVLADYGFATMWLHNDWEGADFIVVHKDGQTHLKVQLKARFTLAKKYTGKDIYVCFREDGETYLYPHDVVLSRIAPSSADIASQEGGVWSCNQLSKANRALLEPYRL